ncbi:hypothetical protein [Bradyrhizobium sp. USDA 223]|uniref:hypothetical protein n=1 Tax=Bradyrhizobium sp. USDA 223 TaxID=3156306 RepID=UPI0038326755
MTDEMMDLRTLMEKTPDADLFAKVLNATWQRCRVGLLKKLQLANSVLVGDSRSAEQTRCWGARSGVSWSSSSRAR